jgi:hypothetical protein
MTKITLKNGEVYDDAYISSKGEVLLRRFRDANKPVKLLTIKEYADQWQSGVLNALRTPCLHTLDSD